MITAFHAKYFAHELTRRFPTDSAEKLAGAVASAQVDINPHQVDAALLGRTSWRAKVLRQLIRTGSGGDIAAFKVAWKRNSYSNPKKYHGISKPIEFDGFGNDNS